MPSPLIQSFFDAPMNDDLPSPTSLILVAVSPSHATLRLHACWAGTGFHYAARPKLVAVDFLAFYQTSMFAEEKWRIESCGACPRA